MNINENINTIFNIIKNLAFDKKQELMNMLTSSNVLNAMNMSEFIADKQFHNHITCPHCNSTHYVKNGKTANNTQRYLCKECGKRFLSTTNTLTDRTQKDLSVWKKFIECMMSGLSCRKSGEICDIHYNTAFVWRHKILDAMQRLANKVNLSGVIEADETFFAVSFKGNHSKSNFQMPRKPHKRGHMCNLRGISHEKICVPCAVTRDGLAISKLTNTGRVSVKALEILFANRIKHEDTMLITDKANAYIGFANNHNLPLMQIKSDETKVVDGMFHIQHVNNFHSRLKAWMVRFNGVATKYLNNYILWHSLVNFANGSYKEKMENLVNNALIANKGRKFYNLSRRYPIPVLAW